MQPEATAKEQGVKVSFTRAGIFMPILLSIYELVATAIIARVFSQQFVTNKAVRELHLSGINSYAMPFDVVVFAGLGLSSETPWKCSCLI